MLRYATKPDGGTGRRRRELDLLGWERYATGRIHVHPMADNHFTLLGPDHVDELAGIFNRVLSREDVEQSI